MEQKSCTKESVLASLSTLVQQCESLMAQADENDPHRIQFAGFLDAAKRQFARHISSVAPNDSNQSEEPTATAAQALQAKASLLSNLGHDSSTFHYKPIGYVESIFSELNGCPRQGTLAPNSRGRIKIRKDLDPKNALRGLEDYSHVWLLFVFHRNTNTKYHPVVAPPKLGGAKLGVFATRTPHRPNHIGLTVASVASIEGDTLHLAGVDLVDGTPILDIKPYVPADVLTDYRVPGWVAGGGQPILEQISRVSFTPEARAQLSEAVPRLKFYKTEAEALKVIEEILLLDIRTTHMREKHTRKVYGVCIDTVNVVFEVINADSGQEISVLRVESMTQPQKKRKRTDSESFQAPMASESSNS